MRLTTVIASVLYLLVFSTCQSQFNANELYESLKNGEAIVRINMDGDPFYKPDSRFKGNVTISPNTIHMDLSDQFESNIILSFSGSDSLLAHPPVKQAIDVNQQSMGSVMIGRIRDKKRRTGDGFLMSAGEVTIESLSEQKIVVRLSGMVGNFNTLRDEKSWKQLEGLLVYKHPTIMMRGGATKSLLY